MWLFFWLKILPVSTANVFDAVECVSLIKSTKRESFICALFKKSCHQTPILLCGTLCVISSDTFVAKSRDMSSAIIIKRNKYAYLNKGSRIIIKRWWRSPIYYAFACHFKLGGNAFWFTMSFHLQHHDVEGETEKANIFWFGPTIEQKKKRKHANTC